MSTVAIDDLVAVCERMVGLNDALFEQLGSWVADEADPATQQWFAVACHRHAWHAELWTERRPKVPIDAPAPAADTVLPSVADDRAAWYRAQLAHIQDELAATEAEVDSVLDPSTTRVIRLVAGDLADLATAGSGLS